MLVSLIFLVCLLIGVPIAFIMAIAALSLIFSQGDHLLLQSFHQQFFGGLENYGLMALPLFILVGELMSSGSMARRLVAMAGILIGPVKGGLAYVNLLSNGFMASILGSAVAQISLMTRIMTPEMERNGYDRIFSVSLSTAGGLLAPILPPSMLFVVYGVLAQTSIGDLFIAGIIPGIMLLAGFCLVIGRMARVKNFPVPDTTLDDSGERQSKLTIFTQGLPALLIPVVIVTSILGGLATPTEAGALAALATIIVGKYIYRDLKWSQIPSAFTRAALSSGVILMLIGSAQVMGFVLTYQQIPLAIAQWIASVAGSTLMFLLLLNLLLLVIGMFIDAIAALIIIVPILLPIATKYFGIDPYQFGIVVCLNLALGLITPPVGSGLFVAASASGENVEHIVKTVLPFIGVSVMVLILLSLFPGITSWLL